MANATLYDKDILLWSEQQADVLRRIARTRHDLPNELDLENVIEEIESVGRSELASVESYLRLILVHLIKIHAEPDSGVARHWRSEILGFRADMMARYAPSMRQRIDIDRLWHLAREQALLSLDEGNERAADLPDRSPFTLDDLIAETIDSTALADRLTNLRSRDVG
jgi:Domain of unknown function DUF29